MKKGLITYIFVINPPVQVIPERLQMGEQLDVLGAGGQGEVQNGPFKLL